MYLIFLFIIPFVYGDRVVLTNSGPVKGLALDSENVEAFLGIPYAEPPVGNLRFARPVPKSPWTETFNANELPPACIQLKMEVFCKFLNHSEKMNEDCLYLHLWVPKSGSIMLPVMVYIHGGAFMTGSSNLKVYNGAALSHHGDVIVASMNYRVGTLGFFCGFIDEAAGNMGMYDQILAIQWIKDNAKHFGGNPDNIVLFGESAGAASIGLHMVSPLSKSLFNRVILQSGSIISPAYTGNEILRTGSQTVSKFLKCADDNEQLNENPKSVVECMKSLPPEKFAEADLDLFRKQGTLRLRIGDEFLPMSPIDLFRKGQFKDSEVLLGVTRDEGSMIVAFVVGIHKNDVFGETIDASTFNETLAEEVVKFFAINKHSDKIIQKYFKKVEEESGYTYLNAAIDIMGDAMLTCGTVFQADFQSMKRHPVYFYVFDYRSPVSSFPEWAGVPHFEEVQYVFGNPLMQTFSEHEEEELSKDMMDMWAAFAKTGNPSIPGGLKWPEYTYEDPKYLVIGKRDRIGVRPDNYRCEAWRNLYWSTIDEEVRQNLKNSMD